MSWEDGFRLLEAVLHALQQPVPRGAAAAEELSAVVTDFYNLFNDFLSWPAEASLREDLLRTGERLGELLAVQAGSFFSQPQWYGEGTWQLSVAASLTAMAQCGAAMLRTAPAGEERFCRRMLPLFHASHAALAGLSQAGAPASRQAQSLAEMQLSLLAALYYDRNPQDPVMARLAAGLPPDALAAWLAGVLEFMPRTRTGCPVPRVLCQLAEVYGAVCASSAFSDHEHALQHHPQLCGRIVAALLPVVRAAAVAARLPPDLQQGQPLAALAWWQAVTLACKVLTSGMLQPALGAWVAAAGMDSLAAHTGSLVQLTAAALEPGCCGGASDDCQWAHLQPHALASLTGLLCTLLDDLLAPQEPGRVQGGGSSSAAGQLSPQQRQRLAAQVLPELCRLGAALRVVLDACGQLEAEAAGLPLGGLCQSWNRMLFRLAALIRWTDFEPNQLPGWADLTAWCGAAAAGLQALPLLADAHRQLLHLGDARGADDAVGAADMLVTVAGEVGALAAVAAMAAGSPSSILPPPGPGDLAALVDALWLLHSTTAKAVFWAEAGAWQQLPCLESDGVICGNLATLLLHAAQSASLARHQAASVPAGGAPGACTAEQRCRRASCSTAVNPVAAMCVVHWEVLHLLLASPMLEAYWRKHCVTLLQHLSILVACGPAALATGRRLQALLRDALDSLIEQPGLRSDSYSAICDLRLLEAPRLATLLLTCGWLEQMLKDLPRLMSASSAVFGGLVGSILTGLLKVKEAAAAELNGSAHGGSSYQQQLSALGAALDACQGLHSATRVSRHVLQHALPPARQLAAALQERWSHPEQAEGDRLELAQAAAARSCAYLRCANLGGEGGPAAGQGRGSKRCGKCRAAWYCGTECSHADWRGTSGHRHMCDELAAARQASSAAVAPSEAAD